MHSSWLLEQTVRMVRIGLWRDEVDKSLIWAVYKVDVNIG
jgi:hypothetical protein